MKDGKKCTDRNCNCRAHNQQCTSSCTCYNCKNEKPKKSALSHKPRSRDRAKKLNKLRVRTKTLTGQSFLISQGKEIRQEWNKKQTCLLFAILCSFDLKPPESVVFNMYNYIVTISKEYGYKKTLKQIQLKMKELEEFSK